MLIIIPGISLADDSVIIEVAVKSDNLSPKRGANPQDVSQRWLDISARGFHLENPASIRIEWALYGDDLVSGAVTKQGSGIHVVDLAQGKKASTVTKPVTFSFMPRHPVKTSGGRRASYKMVDATGVRYHGWSVRAFMGDQLVGESYSSSNIKKLQLNKSE